MVEETAQNQDILDDDVDDQEEPSSRKKIIFFFIGGVLIVFIIMALIWWFTNGSKDASESGNKKTAEIVSSKTLSQKTEKKTKRNKRIKYERLYSTLSGTQISDVLRELSFADIPFSTEQKGKTFDLLIDRDRITEAKNLLAVKGLPTGGPIGYEIFDSAQNLGVTEFDKRVRLVRAISGELEKAIIQFRAIENAKVQVVIPEQRLFSVTQPPVTSSVLLRKRPGAELTDDVVYSIIQLVANAVENLQPENISVIDVEGIVLSLGIFERIAQARIEAERALLNAQKEEILIEPLMTEQQVTASKEIFTPDQLSNWLKNKKALEHALEQKAIIQLLGILPAGSFKLSVTADINEYTENPVISKLSISIVVDSSRADIVIDTLSKKQIFTTIAGAVGYQKGRDVIKLTKADFSLLSEQERQAILLAAQQYMQPPAEDSETQQPRYMYYGILSLLIIGLSLGILRFIRKRQSQLLEKSLEEDQPTDFMDIQQELSLKRDIEQVKKWADEDPEFLANTIQNWMANEPIKEMSHL